MTDDDKAEPFPLSPPNAPRRNLTPPAQRAASGEFEIDAKTPARAHAVLAYQSLISVFDALSPAARLDFTELCDMWLDFDAAARRRVIDFAKREPGADFPESWDLLTTEERHAVAYVARGLLEKRQ